MVTKTNDSRSASGGMETTLPESPGAAPGAELLTHPTAPYRIDYHSTEPFMQLLEKRISMAAARQDCGGLLVVAITNLPMIVNSYGHDASEGVMHTLIRQFAALLSPEDAVQRINRDQIGIVCSKADRAQLQHMAHDLHHLVQNYGNESLINALHVTCSIASIDFPATAKSATDALDKAYVALHTSQGATYRTFESARNDAALWRQQMGLANYLRKAVNDKRIRLAYQPIIEATTGKIVYYEALLRIVGEDGKISSAGVLIPIAETMGLIDRLDATVLEMVATELNSSPDVTLAFNISSLTTDNAHWLARITELTKEYPGIATRMIVEITETAAQRNLPNTAMFVASLQELGCQVALDDFGSGYTSFRQLKALSVDIVKIDGAFVRDVVDNVDNRLFVKTLLDFTNGFGLKAVAEYVENGETAKMLIELGVGYMQGYYFGRPENRRRWLTEGEYGKS